MSQGRCKTFHPPRIHNLLRLCELADINPSSEMIDTLQMVNQYNIEGRYPEGLDSPPTLSEAKAEVNQVKEVFEWLIQIL
jgi:HEPN domain-containing protein